MTIGVKTAKTSCASPKPTRSSPSTTTPRPARESWRSTTWGSSSRSSAARRTCRLVRGRPSTSSTLLPLAELELRALDQRTRANVRDQPEHQYLSHRVVQSRVTARVSGPRRAAPPTTPSPNSPTEPASERILNREHVVAFVAQCLRSGFGGAGTTHADDACFAIGAVECCPRIQLQTRRFGGRPDLELRVRLQVFALDDRLLRAGGLRELTRSAGAASSTNPPLEWMRAADRYSDSRCCCRWYRAWQRA